jgi:hypothetical protein
MVLARQPKYPGNVPGVTFSFNAKVFMKNL